jgi:hypothetical protein
MLLGQALIWLTPQLVEFVESFFRHPKGFVDDAKIAKKLRYGVL